MATREGRKATAAAVTKAGCIVTYLTVSFVTCPTLALLLGCWGPIRQTDLAPAWVRSADKWLRRPNSNLALSFPGMATSTTSHRPIKGILKNKSSTSSVEDSTQPSGRPGAQELQRKKSQKWDESNILATHYPSYKDYDLMKTNEPGNPFASVPHDGEDNMSEVQGKEAMTAADTLAKKLAASDTFGTSYQGEEQESSSAHSSKFFLDKQERQRQFELKRKLHYNEGLNIKLARQLILEELQSEVEEDDIQPHLHSSFWRKDYYRRSSDNLTSRNSIINAYNICGCRCLCLSIAASCFLEPMLLVWHYLSV